MRGIPRIPIRPTTPRDIRRLGPLFLGPRSVGYVTCADERGGWVCSLKPRHRGKHEAWATEPLELCFEWGQEAKETA